MSILILFIAAIAGIVPMLIALTIIYWLDRYEREPWWLVALIFLWGAIGGAGFGCFCNTTIISSVHSIFGEDTASWVGPVIVAPLVEEVTKILPLFGLALMRQFDNATDGLIYGAATGLGFAMTENIMYFYSVGSSAGLGAMAVNILIRTFFTAMVHCAASASWGFFLGVARYRNPLLRWIVIPPLGYGVAVAIHAFWNGSATFSQRAGSIEVQAGACAIIFFLGIFMFLLTQASLYMEHRAIRQQLELESKEHGIIPQAHIDIIPFWLRRSKSHWLPSHIDKDAYVRAVTLLAFRRHQLTHATPHTRNGLEQEIAVYRQQVRVLLASLHTSTPHTPPLTTF